MVWDRHGGGKLEEICRGAVHTYVGNVRRFVILPLGRAVRKFRFKVDIVQNPKWGKVSILRQPALGGRVRIAELIQIYICILAILVPRRSLLRRRVCSLCWPC